MLKTIGTSKFNSDVLEQLVASLVEASVDTTASLLTVERKLDDPSR